MEKEQKINHLLNSQSPGVVYLSSWLTENGFSTQLLNRYRSSNWIYSIGTGAWMRVGEKPTYQVALSALQGQADHPGGKTALSLLGKVHYLELSTKKIMLFGGIEERLPAWFSKYYWGIKVNYYSSSFLPSKIGLQDLEQGTFNLLVSNPIRALMEYLYLTPKKQDLVECYEIMEGLNNLRPKQVQELLGVCTSIKVKRLFLYMEEKARHDWVKYIDLIKIDLGKGKRSLVRMVFIYRNIKSLWQKHWKIMSNYKQQVSLLLQVLPEVAKEPVFALHGGTAINLFVRNMNRLSVDIDLTYIPIADRKTSFKYIIDGLDHIKTKLKKILPEVLIP